ncbi:TrmB family transcriptional regulator [Halococcus dombrowskii]|uniref:TrmB family transcriptional regulator n=1 Tax=Halococcus dombrowskii TaxID=179637 RepID=A0AAV3SF32_HALDO|nr:helix-turn-helix domain-containing protein [Halococcus dombrowskii]UOO94551.1 TrmB family transcriptional regulator [Halococcus dombrowskii]
MSDHDEAVAALKRLGLSSYEAQVFIALQRLDTATVREVDRTTEVPRSQIYGAAEDLAERGLVDIQQSNPIQYRAVDLDEARTRLRERLDREEDRAFDYLESARRERADESEAQEDIWTVQGTGTIDDRVVTLIGDADERVVFGAREEGTFDDVVADALTAAGERGVAVTVVDGDRARERFGDDVSFRATTDAPNDERSGRVLVVDADTVLISVTGGDGLPAVDHEAAIWSAHTGFATVLVGLLDVWFDQYLEDA